MTLSCYTIRKISQISPTLIVLARKNRTSTSPLRFNSPFTTMNRSSAPSNTKIVRGPLPSSANHRARTRLEKINRGSKDRIERKDHRPGVHAREHRSDNNTSGCLLLFSAPVLPLVLSGITRCAHAEEEELAREAEDEEGGQEAPETGERTQPVPPRSVSLP